MAGQLLLSPLQLKNLVFQKVSIETSIPVTSSEEELQAMWAPEFDFSGVELKVKLELAGNPEQGSDATEFMVTVDVQVPNTDPSRKKAPYTIDVVAIGWFLVDPSVSEDRGEIVRVNGASLVLGAIRDLVSTITARSALGLLVLPTLRLTPNLKKNQDASVEQAEVPVICQAALSK